MSSDSCDLLCLDLPKAEALRDDRIHADDAARVAAQLKALADPTRLTIAVALDRGGELCVCDLAWITERAENLVSHHLRALRDKGLVTSRRQGKMVLYEVTDRGSSLLVLALATEEAPA